MAALGVVIVWTLYLARDVLLLIYVSGLLAIGFGPIVQAIEHQQVVPVGQRLPRWLAILVVYLLIVGTLIVVGLLVIPPLVTQARALWTALPELIDQGQALLIRYGLLEHPITLEEAVRRAPATGDAVGTVAMAATGVVSGVFALLTVLILTFYLLIESDSLFRGFARLFPRRRSPARSGSGRRDFRQSQRVAERAVDPGGRDRRDRGRWPVCCWAFRTFTCWRSSPPSAR